MEGMGRACPVEEKRGHRSKDRKIPSVLLMHLEQSLEQCLINTHKCVYI